MAINLGERKSNINREQNKVNGNILKVSKVREKDSKMQYGKEAKGENLINIRKTTIF